MRQVVVQSPTAPSSLAASVTAVFGHKIADCLTPFETHFILPAPTAPSPPATFAVHITGLLSRPAPGSGRPSGDRQLLFVNGRPVDLPRVTRLLNETYRWGGGGKNGESYAAP